MTNPERSPGSPTPENPKGGIEIVLPDLDDFYEFVRDNLSKYRPELAALHLHLSKTPINDSLFEYEETDLVVSSPLGSLPISSFIYSTRLVHSNEKVGSSNFGYYDEKTQRLILEARLKRDVHVRRTEGVDFEIFLDQGKDITAGLVLGPHDRVKDATKKITDWHQRNPRPAQGKLSDREYQPMIAEYEKGRVSFEGTLDAITNREIYVQTGYFDYRTRSIQSRGFYIDDKRFLEHTLKAYTAYYKSCLEALYEGNGLPVPDLKINLRVPEIPSQEPQKEKVPAQSGVQTSTDEAKSVLQEKTSEWEGFEAVAGQDEAVKEAKKLVQAIKNPEIYQKRGVKLPKGILLYGPPGTGKTLLAKAVAKESGANFIEVSVADIGSKWHGESEKMLQQIFTDAASNGKTILFFDEFDSLVPPRDDSYEITRKVIAIFNQNMDGIRSNSNVTVIAATNRPEGIDLAAKRSGRFDKIIEMGLPDEKGRTAIFQKHIDKAKANSTEPESVFSPELDFEQISQVTNGMSGADIANLVNRVLEEKLTKELGGETWTPVDTSDILDMAYKLTIERTEKVEVKFTKKS